MNSGIAAAPTATDAASPLFPAAFRHPRANREALLDGLHVAYHFRRGQRRTIGFSVGPDGLVVSAPRWVPLAEVDAALQAKAGWVARKLGESRERQQAQQATGIAWGDGAVFPLLGAPVTVQLGAPAGRGLPEAVFEPQLAAGAAAAAAAAAAEVTEIVDGAAGAALHSAYGSQRSFATGAAPGAVLHLALPHDAAPARVCAAVQRWLKREALRLYAERMAHFAPLLGVQWTALRLSSAGTRWGSAKSDGAIRLHWRLMHFRLPVIDYVVAHELSHLRAMDHSPRFWAIVASVVPDHAALRAELRSTTLPRWSD